LKKVLKHGNKKSTGTSLLKIGLEVLGAESV